MRDLAALSSGALPPAAVCVIGSGAAGTSVALQLADAGVDVVLLEAGGPRAAPVDPLVGDLSGAPQHDPLERVRQRRLGGTTAQWGGRCAPFDHVDFERRDWVPGSGWPVSRDELLPWYRKAADLLRLGTFAWTAAEAMPAAAAGRLFAPAADEQPGAATSDLTDDGLWRWSPPVRFWQAFRTRLESHPRVQVVPHAPVVRLEQDVPGGPVTCAVVARPDGTQVRVGAREFVVAVGGVETARLLLASDETTPGGIGNSGDQLGRNYMIHPLAEIASVRVAPDLPIQGAAGFVRSHDGVWVRRMLRLSDDAQRRLALRNAAFALWYPDPRDPSHRDGLLSTYALLRLALARSRSFKGTGVHRRYGESSDASAHAANVLRDLPQVVRYGGRWTRERWLQPRTLPAFALTRTDMPQRLRFDAEQSPEPENRVVLSHSTDSLGMRRIALHHRVGRDDRESLVRTVRRVAECMEVSGQAQVTLPPDSLLLEELTFGDGTHQMGTARMSASPRSGVVDADCRVHDCANLHLAGGAVFSTGGHAGPTMTIVALALRLADRLVEEQRARAVVGA